MTLWGEQTANSYLVRRRMGRIIVSIFQISADERRRQPASR